MTCRLPHNFGFLNLQSKKISWASFRCVKLLLWKTSCVEKEMKTKTKTFSVCTICMCFVKSKWIYCLSCVSCRRRRRFFLFYLITNQRLVCNTLKFYFLSKKSKNSQPTHNIMESMQKMRNNPRKHTNKQMDHIEQEYSLSQRLSISFICDANAARWGPWVWNRQTKKC